MINSIQALVFNKTGKPDEVIRVERLTLPDIKPSQVLVKMHASPINPADLNVLEGTYPLGSTLPAVAGNEGVGVVVKTGIAVADVRAGQTVIAPFRQGFWCEAYVAEGQDVVPIPPGIPAEQAAMMTINPPTAYRMLQDFGSLKPGDWVIQNAANSVVGRSVIQLARIRMIKTVNIVRRPELVDELNRIGGTVNLVHGPEMVPQIREATKGARITLGLNGAGGAQLKDMVKCLADDGTLVTYGAMSREPFVLSNAHLIFRNITVRGFWINRWYRQANAAEIKKMFAELCPVLRTGTIQSPVEKSYVLADAAEAIRHASREGRQGKILFSMA